MYLTGLISELYGYFVLFNLIIFILIGVLFYHDCSNNALVRGDSSGAFSLRMLETDVRPPKNEVKRPCPIGLGHSLGHLIVCLSETRRVRSASDVHLINQSHGLPWIT